MRDVPFEGNIQEMIHRLLHQILPYCNYQTPKIVFLGFTVPLVRNQRPVHYDNKFITLDFFRKSGSEGSNIHFLFTCPSKQVLAALSIYLPPPPVLWRDLL